MTFNIQDEVKLNTILDSANNSGDAGQVLSSTGSNTLLWIDQGDVTIPGSNTEILFNNSGLIGANNQFVFDKETSRLGIGTNTPTQSIDVVGTINISANVHVSGALKANGEFGTDGQILSANSTGGVYWTNPGVTSTSFVELTDTPSAYTGAASRFVKVNSGASALEFVADPGYLTSVSQDTAPQLGGNLDAQNNNITNLGTINTHTIPGGTGTLALTSDLTGGTVTASDGADNRVAVFTTDSNIEGDANFTWDGSTLDTGASNAVKAQRFIARTSTYTSITDYALEDNGVIRAGTGLWLVGGATGLTTGIQFGTRPSAANDSSGGWNADVTERMRIQNDGNVGIACTSPTVALDVVGNAKISSATEAKLIIEGDTNNDTGEEAALLQFKSDGGAVGHIIGVEQGTDNDLVIAAGDGTVSSVAAGLSFKTKTTGTTTPVEYMSISSSGTLFTFGNVTFNELGNDLDFRVESNNNENMLFVDGGQDRVAIGTTTALNDLLTVGNNTDALTVNVASAVTTMRMGAHGSGAAARFDYDRATGKLTYKEGPYNSEGDVLLSVTNAGRFGIGTDNPSGPFDVRAATESRTYVNTSGRLIVESAAGGDVLQLIDTGATSNTEGNAYIELLWKDGLSGTENRMGYWGFSSSTHTIWNQVHQIPEAQIRIQTTEPAGVAYENVRYQYGETAFNDGQRDINFRVESDNNANMLFVDAGEDRVGIACSAPTVALDIVGATQITNQGDGLVQLKFNTERPWSFLQNSTGASAQLELNSEVDAKIFKITSQDRSSVFEALAHNTDADAKIYMVPNGGLVGIGTTSPAATLDIDSSNNIKGIDILVNDTIADQNFNANVIDYNISGSDTVTSTKYHRGLFIDVDSSATGGDPTNEHNIYGLDTNVTITGDSDRTYGNVAQVIASHTSGTIQELRGAYSYARPNAPSGSTGVVTNATGAFNLGYATHQAGNVASLRGAFNHGQIASSATGTVSAVYGSYNYADVIGGGTTTNAYGSYSRVRVDSGGEVTTGFGVLAQIETTSAADITGNGFLFRGNYPSTSEVTGTAYGLYITNEDINYFSGDVGIGVTSPSGPFDVRADSDSRTYVGSTGKITTESSAGGAILTLAHTGSTLTDTTAASYIALSRSPSVGGSLERMGYFGYGSASGTTWSWVNEINGADTRIYTQDSGGNNISHIRLAETEINFNVDQIDLDFRVESDTNAYALFIRGSDSRIGINNSSPAQALDVAGTINTSANVHITGAIRDSGGSYGTSGQVLSSTGTGGIDWIDAGSGGGVNATGTPVDNQIAVWTAADTIEGDADFTWDGSNMTIEAAASGNPTYIYGTNISTSTTHTFQSGAAISLLGQTFNPHVEIHTWRAASPASAIKFLRARGGTSGPANISGGDTIGNIYFYAYTGGSYQIVNFISSNRFTTVGGTGADLSFGGLSEHLTIDEDGDVGIGITDPGGVKLNVIGNIKAGPDGSGSYGHFRQDVPTYAELSVLSAQAGDRNFVSDSTTTTFNATVTTGGGSNIVPVFYDGGNWRVG